MTPPRQILPGTTYLVTRRCSERRYLLRPSKATGDILLFVLATAASRYGIQLHAYCAMSNHLHLVLSDPLGALPDFQRYLDSLIARSVNSVIGHREAFWDRESYHVIALETREDILAKLVYVLANPVAAALVRRGRDWPGAWSGTRIGGAPVTVERPKRFFRAKRGPLPATVQLELHRPPRFEDDPTFVESLERALAAEEDRVASRLGREGRSFLGVARVLAQKWYARPARTEPFGRLHPRVAGLRAWVRMDALLRLREFWAAYREALAAWREGRRDVLFPPGTWAMRVHHGARCAASDGS